MSLQAKRIMDKIYGTQPVSKQTTHTHTVIALINTKRIFN